VIVDTTGIKFPAAPCVLKVDYICLLTLMSYSSDVALLSCGPQGAKDTVRTAVPSSMTAFG
jgi:hypothetical protein